MNKKRKPRKEVKLISNQTSNAGISYFSLTTTKRIWVLLTSVFGALFKHPIFSNYYLKKSTITIFNAFNTQLFIKNVLFKMFKERLRGTRQHFPKNINLLSKNKNLPITCLIYCILT